jgi:hypothetical protein
MEREAIKAQNTRASCVPKMDRKQIWDFYIREEGFYLLSYISILSFKYRGGFEHKTARLPAC